MARATRFAERLKAWRAPPTSARPARPTNEPEQGRWGICCSGGGIRSASYSLGALQVLREEGILARADYLSAVSGGSYIASAFTHAEARADADDPVPAYAPGSPEESLLRNNSSYMAPDAAGKARLVARIVAGAGWHVLLVFLLAAIVFLPLSWLYAAMSDQLAGTGTGHVLPSLGWLALIAAVPFIQALACNFELWRADRRRVPAERASVVLMLVGALLAILLVVVPEGVLLARAVGDVPAPDVLKTVVGGDGGGADDAGGLLGILGGAAALTAIAGALSTFVSPRRGILLRAAAFVAGPMLLLLPVLIVVNVGATEGFGLLPLAVWVGLVALAVVVEVAFDPTQWSLHHFYRRRLSSAFYARRHAGSATPVPEDQQLTWQELDRIERERTDGSRRAPFPRLLVCAAANVTEPGASPPGRNAVPFVFTSRNVGVPGEEPGEESALLHRRPMGEYRLAETTVPSYPPGQEPLTVAASVAMSGAAVSPLMGKKTVRAIRVLLTLMNVRLGVWLPNPACEKPPQRAVRPHFLIKEMFGLARPTDPYLYVTDGGHFDNLGLVELLRRGCTTVFCFDGGGDPPGTFRALGEAVALTRSELQVDIKVDPTPMTPSPDDGLAAQAHVLGTLRFRASPDGGEVEGDATGRIVYCRAAVTADAPWDVRDLAHRDKRFPYHSTMDQLFTDEKFEGYRALGAHAAREAVREWREQTVRTKVLDILRDRAAAGDCVTYRALVNQVRREMTDAELPSLRPLLDELEAEDATARRPPLIRIVLDALPPDADVLEGLKPVFRYYEPLPDGC